MKTTGVIVFVSGELDLSVFLGEAGYTRAEIAELRGDLRAEFHQGQASLETKLIRWMFVFWAGSTLAILGPMLALLKG